MIEDSTLEMQIYNKYVGKLTCAFEWNVIIDEDNRYRVNAKRTAEREKYLFTGFRPDSSDNIVLIDCPIDVLAIEFEKHSTKPLTSDEYRNIPDSIKGKFDIKEDDKGNITLFSTIEQRNSWIRNGLQKSKKHDLRACIVSHGGTSNYLYLFNLQGLPEGKEKEAKKTIVKTILPPESLYFIDNTNLGSTLIPIINRSHWKKKQYNGAIHAIIEGISPLEHNNNITKILMSNFQKTWDKDNKGEHFGYRIKKMLKLSDVMKKLGVDMKKNPTACLWHDSVGKRCLSYSDDNGLWYCYHCNRGGDLISFVMEDKKYGFIATINWLKTEFNLQIEIGRSDDINNNFAKAIISFTDFLDMARRFIGVQPLFYDRNKIWWAWNFVEKSWVMVDDVDIMNMINKHCNVENVFRDSVRGAILNSLEMVARAKEPELLSQTMVQFKGKIIDFGTKEEIDASPRYFSTNPIPFEIGECNNTPVMDKLFIDWVGKKYVDTLYEFIAFCLSNEYFLHRIFCLVGSGRNGKSTFLALLRRFLGDKNVCSSELDLLLESKFESSKLFKKLACVMGESNFGTLKRTSILKKLTGQDCTGVEFKNKLPFDTVNYAKIIVATNTLPMTLDKTDGFYRRWFILDFENKFDKEIDILSTIPDVEYNNLARKCVGLLCKLYNERSFSNEGSIADRALKYESKSNPIRLFIKTHCIIDVGYDESFNVFKGRFLNYLVDCGYRQQSSHEIYEALGIEGFDNKIVNVFRDDGKKTTEKRIFGLRMRTDSGDKQLVMVMSNVEC